MGKGGGGGGGGVSGSLKEKGVEEEGWDEKIGAWRVHVYVCCGAVQKKMHCCMMSERHCHTVRRPSPFLSVLSSKTR